MGLPIRLVLDRRCKREMVPEDCRFESCPDYNLVLVEFQKGYTERKTIYLIDIEVSDSWKDSILKSCGEIGRRMHGSVAT
jgi:hypothetical protein